MMEKPDNHFARLQLNTWCRQRTSEGTNQSINQSIQAFPGSEDPTHLLCWSRSSSGTLNRNFLLLRVRTISFLLWSDVSGMVRSPSAKTENRQPVPVPVQVLVLCLYLMRRCWSKPGEAALSSAGSAFLQRSRGGTGERNTVSADWLSPDWLAEPSSDWLPCAGRWSGPIRWCGCRTRPLRTRCKLSGWTSSNLKIKDKWNDPTAWYPHHHVSLILTLLHRITVFLFLITEKNFLL